MVDVIPFSDSDKNFKYINNGQSISLESLLGEYYNSFDDKSDWKDLIYLDNDYKNIFNKYFENMDGRFNINNNILYIDVKDWGIEKFYINNIKLEKYICDVVLDKFINIYNVAVSIQIANWSIFLKMEDYLINFKNININIYFILINELAIEENINYINEKYNNFIIIKAENKGMDIGLFLRNLYYIKLQKYNHDYLFKIHTKTNDTFRNETLYSLMGSPKIVINNIKKLSLTKNGMISGNLIYKYNEYRDAFSSNMYYLEILINELYENTDYDKLEFSAGTMFIVKTSIFNIITIDKIESLYNRLNNYNTLDYHWYSIFYKLDINDKKNILQDFINNKNERYPNNLSYCLATNKSGLRDSMIEHAIERLFGYICKNCGLDIVR